VAREQRKLAAILDADVVGYARLMGRDESSIVARLREIWIRRLDPALTRHSGRLVKLAGDGALIEFPSAVDALSAAIEFQQATTDANRGEPDDTAIIFRMGLHLGDVIIDGNDLYGDAVNVADRLEAQAPPGGIVVSEAVREAVAGRLKATFVDHGNLTLKNIERPIHAFVVNWNPSDWPLPQTAARHTPFVLVDAIQKRRALWVAFALGVVVLAVISYRAFGPFSSAAVADLKELKAEDLEHLLAERRGADAAMAEKKRLEEEARARAEAESETVRQTQAALTKAREDRQRAEADLVKLRADIAARREARSRSQQQLVDNAARQAAEEEAQHKAEAEMTTLREAENEAERKAASDAENKRKADEALAIAQAERQKAQAKADAAPASGVVVWQSNFSVPITAQRFEEAVRSLEQERGIKVVREIDIAAIRQKAGLRLLPRIVIELDDISGRSSLALLQAPTVTLEGLMRVVVWQDSQDKVWLAHNSADWIAKLRARHGLNTPIQWTDTFEGYLREVAKAATQ